jgi:hypothetical protein
VSPLLNLYQELAGVNKFKRLVKIEEELDGLLDRYIDQAEINSTLLKRQKTTNGLLFLKLLSKFVLIYVS